MKYKLLIADDEYLVRMGIKETIDWASLDIEVVAEASNGKQGLELARTLKPDLIISDVRMPLMDGLEMAKTLLDENADLAVIIYSGYKDFEYARRALTSEVAAYLLKPIENENMIAKVKETLAKLEEKRNKTKMLNLLEKGTPYFRRQLFFQWVSGAGDDDLYRRMELVGITHIGRGRIVYATSSGGEEALFDLLEKLKPVLGEYAAEVTADALVAVTSNGDADMLISEVRNLLVGYGKSTDVKYKLCLSRSFGEELTLGEAYAEVKAYAANLPYSAVNSIGVLDGEAPVMYKKLVRDALKYIEENYARKISIRSVAESLFVSESHLMHEFKESVGKTFNECLTDYRIDKAKELLLTGKYRINEIASEVGYADVKYFGQVFKEMTGMTPGEYTASKTSVT